MLVGSYSKELGTSAVEVCLPATGNGRRRSSELVDPDSVAVAAVGAALGGSAAAEARHGGRCVEGTGMVCDLGVLAAVDTAVEVVMEPGLDAVAVDLGGIHSTYFHHFASLLAMVSSRYMTVAVEAVVAYHHTSARAVDSLSVCEGPYPLKGELPMSSSFGIGQEGQTRRC